MYIITGLGRSGTSFIAEIFHNLGYYMGERNEKVDAGYESPEITNINKSIMNGDYWGTKEENEKMAGLSKNTIIVKDPRFIVTIGLWVIAGAKIDGIFLCTRDFWTVLESSERTNAGIVALFNGTPEVTRLKIMEYLEDSIKRTAGFNRIPLHIIKFPHSLDHFDEQILPLNEVVNDSEALKEAWLKTRRLGEDK